MKRKKNTRPVSDEYRKVKATVKRRDGNKCVLCNYKGRRIEIHHLIRYSDSVLQREDPDNLCCLCISCHKSITGKEDRYATILREIIQHNKKKKK
jgi:5-methylcytosine-specific restriction endonuclease McrA